MKELYEEIDGLNPNLRNFCLTLIEGDDIGEKALVSGDEVTWLSREDGLFSSRKDEVVNKCESGIFEVDGKKVYGELLGHEKKIVICGAGHVSIAIINAAKMIGCRVICIDDRPKFTDNARAAGADEVICDEFKKALSSIPGDNDTYFVIVTRGHRHDQDCLRIIAEKSHAYIGMMGSKRRVAIVRQALIDEGISKEVIDGVCSPIGLDIAAETPEEIAIAIMAEIIEVKNKKHREFGYPADIMEDILGKNHHEEGTPGRKILATIITRKGSAPRQIGTKMLITDDDRTIGTIGGGCVEADVIRRAKELFLDEDIRAELFHVELTDDGAGDEGMVCGGVLDVLLEEA